MSNGNSGGAPAGRRVVVAIDGPAGAGKSTLARRVAERMGFLYIDTGAMYRAVALWASGRGMDLEDASAMEQLAAAAVIELQRDPERVLLNGEDVTARIRAPGIGQAASKVSALGGVRRALVAKQREMAGAQSVVMEGRDIGTVVFPLAEVKIFLDASPEERARRRQKDLAGAQPPPELNEIAREIAERDHRDRTRAEAPLLQAPDAVYIDSTPHGIEELERIILKLIREKISNGKEFIR